jgi:hypothetical protein
MLMIGPFREDYLVSFRNYVYKNGQHTPTKDGIALSIKVWRNILEIQDEINRDIDLVI